MTRKMKDSGVDWIGMIPDGWTTIKMKYAVSISNGSDPKTEGDIPVYGSGSGCFRRCGEFKEGPTVLIGRKGSMDPHYIEGRYWNVDTAFDTKSKSFNLKLFYYIAKCFDYSLYLTQTTIPSMTQSCYENMFLPCTSDDEQKRIADFLDAKCASIDDVIAKTNESIEEYKKLKQAVITEAVTKGVRGKRPMKDSGIDWIGQVPSDWNLQRIKTLFDLRTELNFKPLEEVNLISLYTDKGVVQHADLEKTTGNKAMNADGYKVVYENDIVVNIILCWMGAIGRSAYNGVTSPAYDVYCPKNGVESQFYHYYFRTAGFSGECFTRGRGIMLMRWRTYSDQFRDIRVVVPPLAEQKEIVKYLDSKSAAIDTLISKKQQFIDELTAYKKSLIYEFVTGKKEVPA